MLPQPVGNFSAAGDCCLGASVVRMGAGDFDGRDKRCGFEAVEAGDCGRWTFTLLCLYELCMGGVADIPLLYQTLQCFDRCAAMCFSY